MKEIPLTQGKVAIVDDGDYEWLMRWKWQTTNNGYAKRTGLIEDGHRVRKNIMMHREILQTPDGMETDHINGDRLDNRRGNLRAVSPTENRQHVTRRKAETYKGTRLRDGKWSAYIAGPNNQQQYLGYYETEEEAAIAYNRAAREQWGAQAVLNPIEDREIVPLTMAQRTAKSSSGVYGVTWDKRRKRWNAKIRSGKRHITLGRFDSLDDASDAVLRWQREQENVTSPA